MQERDRERGGERDRDREDACVQGRLAEDMLRPSGWSGRIYLSQRWERKNEKTIEKKTQHTNGNENTMRTLSLASCLLMYYIYSQSLQNNRYIHRTNKQSVALASSQVDTLTERCLGKG